MYYLYIIFIILYIIKFLYIIISNYIFSGFYFILYLLKYYKLTFRKLIILHIFSLSNIEQDTDWILVICGF